MILLYFFGNLFYSLKSLFWILDSELGNILHHFEIRFLLICHSRGSYEFWNQMNHILLHFFGSVIYSQWNFGFSRHHKLIFVLNLLLIFVSKVISISSHTRIRKWTFWGLSKINPSQNIDSIVGIIHHNVFADKKSLHFMSVFRVNSLIQKILPHVARTHDLAACINEDLDSTFVPVTRNLVTLINLQIVLVELVTHF